MNGPESQPPHRSPIAVFFAAALDQSRALAQRIGFELVRTRRAQTIVVCGVALVVSIMTGAMVSSARSSRARWSTSRPVVVAARAIPAGHRLSDTDTVIVRLPPAIVPSDAIATLDPGSSVRIAIGARTPLTRSILRTSERLVDVPRGWRAIAMPGDIATPPLAPGDTVDIVTGSGIAASGGLVVSLRPVTVAVPADVAATVATAARMGEISLISGG